MEKSSARQLLEIKLMGHLVPPKESTDLLNVFRMAAATIKQIL
jgi:hypothetical protein